MLIDVVASDAVIDEAYEWLCKSRQQYHYNNDCWQLRRWWEEKKTALQAQLINGNYRFREQMALVFTDKTIELWSAKDALVLKALSIALGALLRPHLSERVFHLAGGTKNAVREVAENIAEHEFVFRTDVKGYYASIDQEILLGLVRRYVSDEKVLDLIGQYLRRFVSDGGIYRDIERGISLGCPLSPLMGGVYLKPLDDMIAAIGCFYVRFMDDWVVLCPTR